MLVGPVVVFLKCFAHSEINAVVAFAGCHIESDVDADVRNGHEPQSCPCRGKHTVDVPVVSASGRGGHSPECHHAPSFVKIPPVLTLHGIYLFSSVSAFAVAPEHIAPHNCLGLERYLTNPCADRYFAG